MPSEKRTDPDDGVAYTFDELLDFYKGKYKKKALQEYWDNECKPTKRKGKKEASPDKATGKSSKQESKVCTHCGKTNHAKADCKFKDKECNLCGKTGHLSAVCRQAPKEGANHEKKVAPKKEKKQKDPYDLIYTYLRTKTSMEPQVGIICGSGLGGLVDLLSDPTIVYYKDIPGWPVPTVAGHAGELVFGTLHDGAVKVVCMKGRFHGYEGHHPSKLGMGPRVMKLLGVEMLVVTNAAGGIHKDFVVGDIMAIDDHISFPCLSGLNPLVGPNDERFGPRFPAVSDAYDPRLIDHLMKCAGELKLTKLMRKGNYTQVSGPNYESRAECRMLRMVGADAVGMSTVPEVLVAASCGMKILGMSMITNKVVFPDDDAPPANHAEVIGVVDMRTKDMQELVKLFLKDAMSISKA